MTYRQTGRHTEYQPVNLTPPAQFDSPTNVVCTGLASTGARLLLSFSLLWRICRSRWVGKRPFKGREAHGQHISTDVHIAPFFLTRKCNELSFTYMKKSTWARIPSFVPECTFVYCSRKTHFGRIFCRRFRTIITTFCCRSYICEGLHCWGPWS